MLVQERLVACVQIVGPMASVYWWNEKIEKATEWLIIIKTRRSLFNIVDSSIRGNHPYKIPEILAVPIVEGSGSYVSWLNKVLRRQQI